MANELKHCPFCGSKNVDFCDTPYWVIAKYQDKLSVVGCRDCGAFGGVFNKLALADEEAEKRAIKSWNRRATDGE